MANMKCCYQCARRKPGCAIDCKDWAERQAVVEEIRKKRHMKSILHDHDYRAYENFRRDAHNKIKKKSKEGQ